MMQDMFLDGDGTAVLWGKVKALMASGGSFMFSVSEDGDLLLHYTGDTAPAFSIGEDGNLYLKLD